MSGNWNYARSSVNPETAQLATPEPAELSEGNAGTGPRVCCPKREEQSGSGPHLTKETHALLRSRLRAAALMLLLGFGLFLIRHILGLLTGEPFDGLLLGYHILVVLVLAFSAMPLCRQCSVSMAKLRAAELVIFGLPAGFFLMLQHRWILTDVARGVMPPPMPFWLLLIFTYAMFIPNAWRRAALVIGAMALAPILMVAGMVLAYPAVAQTMTPVDFLSHVLTMAVAAV